VLFFFKHTNSRYS